MRACFVVSHWRAPRLPRRTHAVGSALCAALLCVLAAGCGTRETPAVHAPVREWTGSAFQPYDSSRIILDSIRVDLDRNGIDEFVITSRDAFEQSNPALPRQFDRLEIFAFDTTRGVWGSLFVDPVQNGETVEFRDITRRGKLEILATTNTGGNDPVASTGLAVYGFRKDGSLSVLFVAESGAPEIRDIDGDDVPEILVTGQYWGVTPRADVVAYTAEIHSFNGSEYAENNIRFRAYYDTRIAEGRAEYTRLAVASGRFDAVRAAALYDSFLRYVVWIIAKGDLYAVRTVWNTEKQALEQRLDAEQFEDLDGLIEDVLSSSQQADAGTGDIGA